MIRLLIKILISFLLVSLSYITQAQCPKIGFEDITSKSPYLCNTIVKLTAFDSLKSKGYISPGFTFIISSADGSSIIDKLDNYAVFYNNNVKVTTIKPDTFISKWTLYGQYLNPDNNYAIEWCDKSLDGTFLWSVFDHAGNKLTGSGTFDHINTKKMCFKISIPKLKGSAVFSGVGVENNGNGTGTFNPAKAGPGTYDIRYSWDDWAGCSASVTQTVTVIGPVANAGVDKSICIGDNISIGGSPTASSGAGAYKYSWTPSANINDNRLANPIASPTVSTTYTVIVADYLGNGCRDTDIVVVNVKTNLDVSAGKDTLICGGSAANLYASGGEEYKWSNNDTTASIIVAPNSTTDYIVTVNKAGECPGVDTVRVAVVTNPKAAFEVNKIGEGHYGFINNSSNAQTFYWDFGDGSNSNELNPTHIYKQTKSAYKVMLVASSGLSAYCNDTVYYEIKAAANINPPPNIILTKSVNFKNSQFVIEGYGIEYFDIIVFNRWGTEIYKKIKLKASDIAFTDDNKVFYTVWDCKTEGTVVPGGAYFYILKAIGGDATVFEYKGSLNIFAE
ncbi:MAG: gliding motility-associated C-terminal domain-containing protein [Bacteroidales bacterium]|nr:gliding motility-associated C-terminal domain-containing protein [Bacteroidales bacterium]